MPLSKSQQEIAFQLRHGNSRVHLRTQILIRWVSIAGQLGAVLATLALLPGAVPLLPVLSIILASVALNLWAIRRQRRGPTIGDQAAAAYLALDTLQLTLLLYLTGGLANPFVMLLLAPLTVGAAALRRQWVALLTGLVLLAAGVLALSPYHLPWPGGPLPFLFRFGVWCALVLSALFIAVYVYNVAAAAQRISAALHEAQLALGRTRQMAAVGALAAAAAHELGSPLSTIAVAAKELARELPPGSSQAEDAALLLSQVARCRNILAELARDPDRTGAAHTVFDYLDLHTLLTMTAEPYRRPGADLVFVEEPDNDGDEPALLPQPELQRGLANVLQNALQYARHRVTCRLGWQPGRLTIRVEDDGPGFPASVLERLGEPYISSRAGQDGHMGLGIFIAMNLLEKTGAMLQFSNLPQGGASTIVTWQGGSMFGIIRRN